MKLPLIVILILINYLIATFNWKSWHNLLKEKFDNFCKLFYINFMLDVAIRFRLLKEVDEDYVETLLSEVDEVNKIG